MGFMIHENGLYETGELACENGHINKWQRQLVKRGPLGQAIVMELLEGHTRIEGDRAFRCRTCDEWIEFKKEVE